MQAAMPPCVPFLQVDSLDGTSLVARRAQRCLNHCCGPNPNPLLTHTHTGTDTHHTPHTTHTHSLIHPSIPPTPRHGSAGRAVMGYDVRCVDPDTHEVGHTHMQ